MRLPFLFLSITPIFFRFFPKSLFICFLYLYLWRQPIIKDKSRNYKRYEKKETLITLPM